MQSDKRKIVIIFLIALSHLHVCDFLSAQDIHFSQLTETPQLLNPGATGVYNGHIRGIINYKNQWKAMGNSFNTTAASVDAPLMNIKKNKAHLGAGLNFFSDKAGDSKFGLTVVNLCVAGIIPVQQGSSLSMGISVGAAQHKANLSSLSWGNQYNGNGFDPSVNTHETTQLNSFYYLDLGAGIYYEYSGAKSKIERNEHSRFGIGIAYFHLNRPGQKYYSISEKLDGKLTCMVNSCFDLTGTKFSILPSAVFFMQGASREITIGSSLRYRIKNGTKITGFSNESGIAFGIHYRFKDAVIPQVYFEIKDISVGFSYDINISSLRNTSHFNGGPEISLRYNMMKGALLKQ